MKDLGLTPRQKTTNTLVDLASKALGGIHLASSIIADVSYNTEQDLYRKHYRNEDGSKLSSDQLREKAKARLTNTEIAKVKLGVREIDIQSLFTE